MSELMDKISRAGDEEYQLITFSWEMLDVCQYKCSYCSAMNFNMSTFLKSKNLREAWKPVVKLLSLKSIQLPFTVELLGGEPTLHPDIVEIVDKLCGIDNCVQVEFITNLAKPLKFYKQFDTLARNKVNFIASYHPEYYTEKFFDKVVELNKCEHIAIYPNINLPDDPTYWQPTADLIRRFEDNDIMISLNLLQRVEDGPEGSWEPNYTDEFWKFFAHWLEREPVNTSTEKIKGQHPGTTEKEAMVELEKRAHNTGMQRQEDADYYRPYTMVTRGIPYSIDNKIQLLSEADIVKDDLRRFKGWKCRPLMWAINMDGTLRNHCTEDVLPIYKINKENLSACVTCPLERCDCDTKYLYVKERPSE